MDEKKNIFEKLVKELEIKNKSETLPAIKASFETIGPVHVNLVLQNVGKAAAIDINLKIQSEPSGFEKVISYPLLNPGEKIKLFLPESEMKALAKKIRVLKVDGDCKNIFDEPFEIKSHLNVEKIIGSWLESGIMLQYSLDDRLSRIIDKMGRLERTLERMRAFGGGILVKTPGDIRKESEKFEKARKERKKKQHEKRTLPQ